MGILIKYQNLNLKCFYLNCGIKKRKFEKWKKFIIIYGAHSVLVLNDTFGTFYDGEYALVLGDIFGTIYGGDYALVLSDTFGTI